MQNSVRLECRGYGLRQYDRRRNDISPGQQIFLAERAMRRIVWNRCFAVAGLGKGGINRQPAGRVYMRLDDVAGLRKGHQGESNDKPAPSCAEPVHT